MAKVNKKIGAHRRENEPFSNALAKNSNPDSKIKLTRRHDDHKEEKGMIAPPSCLRGFVSKNDPDLLFPCRVAPHMRGMETSKMISDYQS